MQIRAPRALRTNWVDSLVNESLEQCPHCGERLTYLTGVVFEFSDDLETQWEHLQPAKGKVVDAFNKWCHKCKIWYPVSLAEFLSVNRCDHDWEHYGFGNKLCKKCQLLIT